MEPFIRHKTSATMSYGYVAFISPTQFFLLQFQYSIPLIYKKERLASIVHTQIPTNHAQIPF